MIQVHGKTNFINGIQSHNQSPWFKPMANYLSKPKPNNAWQYLIKSPIQLGNILKAHDSSPWQSYFIHGIQSHNQSP